MIRYLRASGAAWLVLLAVMVIAGLPAPAQAASKIGFRNDTDGVVLVQGMSIVNGVLKGTQVHRLQPGQVSWDLVIAPGNKLIIIADGKQPTRTLYKDTVQVGVKDLFFSIQKDTPPQPMPNQGAKPPKQPKPAPPKVKLVPDVVPVVPALTPRTIPRRR